MRNHLTEPFVALLRGVNVGGKNKVAAADLTRIFTEAGGSDVTTFIQSGNILFVSSSEQAPSVKSKALNLIRDHMGKPISIILRSKAECERVLVGSPYFSEGESTDDLFVMFLESMPVKELVENLDPSRSPGDVYVVVGDTVYMKLGTGAADTKLTNAYFDSKLKTVGTTRNWRTLQKLCDLLAEKKLA